MYKIKFRTILFSLVFLIPFSLWSQTTGKISGHVVDGETGDALFGVNILIQGTTRGAATDLDGVFTIRAVPQGQYTLVVTYMGYNKKVIENIEVKSNETTTLDFSMEMQVLKGQEVVVTAKALKNTEAVLLKDRQKASSVSDAVSAEAISRAGSGNAAEAMKQVTGASVVGGKYIYVRGLGDRYTSTQLNGAEIPSTDPYKRAGSIDLIPSNLIDNIVAVKSFTPDKPGNFSGGSVDIRTKDFPQDLTIKFSASSSFNPDVNLKNEGAISYSGGNLDWLGIDDGTREIPDVIQSIGLDDFKQMASNARKSSEQALVYDSFIKSFSSTMKPVTTTFPLNQSYSFSVGNQINFLGRPLGFLTSLSYNHSYSSYQNGEKNNWYLGASSIDAVDELTYNYKYQENKSSDEVLWGGLFKATYKLNPSHFFGFDFVYNRNAESYALTLEGQNPYDYENEIVQSSTIGYNERELYSFQLNGKHQFPSLFNSNLEWAGTLGRSYQDEPDIRYFTNGYAPEGNPQYEVKHNAKPRRFFRTLDGDRNELKIDYTIPFKQWQGKPGSFKMGGMLAQKKKDFSERNFYYRPATGNFEYNGNVDDFLAELGFTSDQITEGTNRYYDMGLVLEELAPQIGWYKGEQNINAGYAMVDLPLSRKIRFIGGARLETTEMKVETDDVGKQMNFTEHDLLPSLNFIYQLNPDMNVRLAYGKTLALPTFREVVPFESYEFIGGVNYFGNSELKRTLIDNYDVRWEWFSRPGEIYAVSLFYKSFQDPIEKRYRAKEKEMTWVNVDHALTYGIEFELRKRLDVVSQKLTNFMVGGNLALVHSQVDIPEYEMMFIKAIDPNASDKRQFEGQSPYILNVNVNYENAKAGISSSLYYNVFGERLAFSTGTATPDVFEQPFHSLNYSLSYKFMPSMGAKFAIKNILNSEYKEIHEFKGIEYVYKNYNSGRTFTLGLDYSL